MDDPRAPSVADRLRAVQARIDAAALRAGRRPGEVTLVAVSKTHGADAVEEALAAGQVRFGENRVQEAQAKFPGLRAANPGLVLHLIGGLQTNKARDAVRVADVIETLDRPRLADALEAAIAAEGRRPLLLVQVNVGDESQKAGVSRQEADRFIADCQRRFGDAVAGLMCIPPADADPAPHFDYLAETARRHGLATLSMGMSNDFEVAIAHGATHVRVGTAIFGSPSHDIAMPIADPVREALVILGAAATVIPLFHRLRLSPVVGYMLIGVLVGPFGLGALAVHAPLLRAITITDREQLAPLAELGIVLLLFMIGLEMSWARLRQLRRLVLGLGAAQFGCCAAAVAGVAWQLGAAPPTAGVIGLALAMSSTAVVTQVLAESGAVTGRVGRTSFAVLLFQDLAALPVLFALGVLGHGEGSGVGTLALAVAQALLTLAAIVAAGRLLLRPLFRGVARAGSPELFMAACLLVVLATGAAATAAGLSASLGALTAGLLLAETEYRRQIEVTVEPFKGLLLGVFLISVGLNLDLGRAVTEPGPVLGAACALVAVKAVLTAGLARAFRVRGPIAVQAALLLAPGGEFGFVILGLAASTGLLAPEVAGFAALVAALTMAVIPTLGRLGRRLAALEPVPVAPDLLPPVEPDAASVIIAGFGRVGRTVALLLEQHGIGYLGLDSDAARVARLRRGGAPVYYGDVTQKELLARVGLASARALVVTVDSRDRADAVVAAARSERPDLLIIVRARDANHAADLYRLGATDAVPETIEASLQLSEAVLVDLGVAMGPVLVSIHEQRARFQAEIKAKVPDADIRARGQLRLRAAEAPRS